MLTISHIALPSLFHYYAVISNLSHAAIKKFCLHARNKDDNDESGDDTDAESSAHSSHGDAESSVDEPKKPKRTRTAFSNLQLDQLEIAFSRSHYPDVFTREDLSSKLNIKEDRIQVCEYNFFFDREFHVTFTKIETQRLDKYS